MQSFTCYFLKGYDQRTTPTWTPSWIFVLPYVSKNFLQRKGRRRCRRTERTDDRTRWQREFSVFKSK